MGNLRALLAALRDRGVAFRIEGADAVRVVGWKRARPEERAMLRAIPPERLVAAIAHADLEEEACSKGREIR
jgi:hypothetical protein